MTPHKCPVCDGTGKASKSPQIAGDIDTWSSSNMSPCGCHACTGTGIIWEPETFYLPEIPGITYSTRYVP